MEAVARVRDPAAAAGSDGRPAGAPPWWVIGAEVPVAEPFRVVVAGAGATGRDWAAADREGDPEPAGESSATCRRMAGNCPPGRTVPGVRDTEISVGPFRSDPAPGAPPEGGRDPCGVRGLARSRRSVPKVSPRELRPRALLRWSRDRRTTGPRRQARPADVREAGPGAAGAPCSRPTNPADCALGATDPAGVTPAEVAVEVVGTEAGGEDGVVPEPVTAEGTTAAGAAGLGAPGAAPGTAVDRRRGATQEARGRAESAGAAPAVPVPATGVVVPEVPPARPAVGVGAVGRATTCSVAALRRRVPAALTVRATCPAAACLPEPGTAPAPIGPVEPPAAAVPVAAVPVAAETSRGGRLARGEVDTRIPVDGWMAEATGSGPGRAFSPIGSPPDSRRRTRAEARAGRPTPRV